MSSVPAEMCLVDLEIGLMDLLEHARKSAGAFCENKDRRVLGSIYYNAGNIYAAVLQAFLQCVQRP